MWYTFADSRIGRLAIAGTEKGIGAVRIGDDDEVLLDELRAMFRPEVLTFAAPETNCRVKDTIKAVEEPTGTHALSLDLRGTACQQVVWAALQEIPAGETVTYTDLARRIGKDNAVRAVGSACGANPVAVVIPCHRVVRSDGDLGGYRWGLERKEQLLAEEAAA